MEFAGVYNIFVIMLFFAKILIFICKLSRLFNVHNIQPNNFSALLISLKLIFLSKALDILADLGYNN